MPSLDPKEKKLLFFLLTVTVPFCTGVYFLKAYAFPSFSTLELTGLLFTVYQVCKVVLLPLKNKLTRTPVDLNSYGNWAIVTGCTSGIGERYAEDLAGRGFNLLLISRSESKLEGVKGKCVKIAREGGFDSCEVKCVAHDFGTQDAVVRKEFYSQLTTIVDSLDSVGLLINNVGLSNDLPQLLHEIPESSVQQMLQVNNSATVDMSRAVLPKMYAQKKGAIVTISSASCTHPTPLLTCYSATKSFGNQLTRSMHYEYKEHGIDCLSLTPYYFVSNMFKRKKATYLAPFPQVIVDKGWEVLGHEAEAYPYWGHWSLGQIGKLHWDVGGGMLKIMTNIRKRADAKAAKGKVE